MRVGASVGSTMSDGRPLLLFVQEQAEKGTSGFRELADPLMAKIGQDVDRWQHPACLPEEGTAECPICFETLWTATPTAFVKFLPGTGESVSHVICAHFFCFDCASQQYMKQSQKSSGEYFCPICRAPAQEVMPLPDIKVNPRLWFQFLDLNCSGSIDQNTVVQALEAMLPIDTESMHEAMAGGHCSDWMQEGTVSELNFFQPTGLLQWIRSHQHELQRANDRGQAPPIVGSERDAWFKHWDTVKSGRLGKGDVLLSLCEAGRVSSLETKRVAKLKDGIAGLWEKHALGDGLTRQHCRNAALLEAFSVLAKDAKEPGG